MRNKNTRFKKLRLALIGAVLCIVTAMAGCSVKPVAPCIDGEWIADLSEFEQGTTIHVLVNQKHTGGSTTVWLENGNVRVNCWEGTYEGLAPNGGVYWQWTSAYNDSVKDRVNDSAKELIFGDADAYTFTYDDSTDKVLMTFDQFGVTYELSFDRIDEAKSSN